MAGKWDIVCKPEGKTTYKDPDGDDDEGINEGAMKVLLVNGSFREEIARVGFAREHSKNPSTPYKTQLDSVIDRARVSAELLNKQFEFSGQLL
jgi:hypothetical protein